MKTYSETKNKEKFDWFKFLDDRIAEGSKNYDPDHVSDEEQKKLRKKYKKEIALAGSWTTCACGNMCSILSRDADGEPSDEELAELGSDFYYEVYDLDWKHAKETLKAIERRSSKLINEQIQASKKTLSALGYKIVAPAAKKVKNK